MSPKRIVSEAFLVGIVTLVVPCARADDHPLRVAALRLGVTDLAASVDFYQRFLGFEMHKDRTDAGYIVLDNHGVPLVLTQAETPVAIEDGACHVRFNFKTDDLDRTVAMMRAGGVRILGEHRSAVGRYVSFLDPSGHRHNIDQLDWQKDPLPRPELYNVGISVRDMDQARSFYADVLGFAVMTEKYYPPVIPFNQRGKTFFILSDGADKPAPYHYGQGAFIGLALETNDLAATMTRLRAAGVAFLDEQPRRIGEVSVAAFSDPDGNVHELIQPASESGPSSNAAASVPPEKARRAYDRLKALAGQWEGVSTKGWKERITYEVMAAGSCVMEDSFDAHPNERMITMFCLDRDRLLLTHYCVAKNQPRLLLTEADDDLSQLTFTFLDGTNLPTRDRGHMDKVVFKFQGPDKFTSQWTWYQDGAENWLEEIVHTRVGQNDAPSSAATR